MGNHADDLRFPRYSFRDRKTWVEVVCWKCVLTLISTVYANSLLASLNLRDMRSRNQKSTWPGNMTFLSASSMRVGIPGNVRLVVLVEAFVMLTPFLGAHTGEGFAKGVSFFFFLLGHGRNLTIVNG